MNKGIHVYMQPRRYGQTYAELIRLTKENEKLKSIIKEVREHIQIKQIRMVNESNYQIQHSDFEELLEILDKENL